ncbi:thiamine biosynthesis protein ThiF [Sulfurimonas aquatica]|uniref:Thiamine biosynthesis protein ThiF n=1 Tax=Sulfurimonas aquatica TaxID=2672570 RepID=A0A975AYY4_9BACT|nr:thiamine biosynthesis protein ThiF [Sulfurimonas aquatica]QSZ41157.1 thiamine biosynthesis protein ThiF [Sulfurimonas aquatica]
MMDGFDLNSALVCEGIIGDGCGGGRVFFVEDETLKTFDPLTKSSTLLLEGIVDALSVSKKACIITISTKSQEIKYDLSLLQQI